MHPRRPFRRFFLLFVAVAPIVQLSGLALRAETQGQAEPGGGGIRHATVVLRGDTPARLNVESSVDDRSFRAPNGFEPGAVSLHFNRTVTIRNVGDSPVRRPRVVVNGFELGSFSQLARSIELENASPETVALRMYNFWKDYHYHADARIVDQRSPFAAINYWGYTLCNEDTIVLRTLFASQGFAARSVPLSGHVAAEYRIGDRWSVIDGDLNAIYLQLDNRTLASYSDIVMDPFLALRTQAYGKYAGYDPARSWFSMSLFDHDRRKRGMPLESDLELVQDMDSVDWSLYPGEQLVFHHDKQPELVAGANPDVSRSGLGEITFTLLAQDRPEAAVPYPVTRVVYEPSGREFRPALGELRYDVPLDADAETATVFSHGVVRSFPALRAGSNDIRLAEAEADSLLEVDFTIEPRQDVLPAVRVLEPRYVFSQHSPRFTLDASPGVRTLWWQISNSEEFDLLAPNLDNVVPYSNHLELSDIASSFLNPDQDYFLRMRVEHDGIWSGWSAPVSFRMDKPDRPTQLEVESAGGDGHVLRWDASQRPGDIFLVFGSNRRDFMPHIFHRTEITAMEDGNVSESRPNRNLLATTAQLRAEIDARFRYYRIIAKRGDLFSVPSGLLVVPPELSPSAPATILQTRHRRLKDPTAESGFRDRYISTQVPVDLPSPRQTITATGRLLSIAAAILVSVLLVWWFWFRR